MLNGQPGAQSNELAQILQMVFSNPQMLQQLLGGLQMQGASGQQDPAGNPLSAIMQGAMPPQGGPSPMDQMTQGGPPMGAGGPPPAPAAPPPPAHKGGHKPPPHKGK